MRELIEYTTYITYVLCIAAVMICMVVVVGIPVHRSGKVGGTDLLYACNLLVVMTMSCLVL